MARVYLSLGSNIRRYQHIHAGLDALDRAFVLTAISSVYESEAVGFNGSPFLNLVVAIETTLPVGVLSQTLKSIEDANGRVRGGPKFAPRTLDIDILTYDDLVGCIEGVVLPRDEILHNAFVLWPLAEIAPQDVHPELLKPYHMLWQTYDKTAQQLWPVDFVWQGRVISPRPDTEQAVGA